MSAELTIPPLSMAPLARLISDSNLGAVFSLHGSAQLAWQLLKD